MSRRELMKVLIEAIGAFGTLAVAILAIWGPWVRSKLAPLSLTLTLDPEAEPVVYSNRTQAMYYHLRVINRRPWLPAENCRVVLVGFSRRDSSGNFQPARMAFPCQFTWAPVEFNPIVITLHKEQVVDLGYVEDKATHFIPRFYATPFNFQGFVGPNEAIRYQVQVTANDYVSSIYVIEVAWDGVWSFDPHTMKQHLPIRVIPG
jgi:hypothetical protein